MNNSIELLRFISVLLIIFTHTRHDITEGVYYVLFEVIPTYGTAVLSIISGYLYLEYSSKKNNLLYKKIQTLLIPYIIANISLIISVYLLSFFGYNFLDRLSFDLNLIIEGLFSLSSEPINPPTYFIRDLFLLFCIISLFKKKYLSLIFILPYMVFGTLFLRVDVILLFIVGSIISYFKNKIILNKKVLIFVLLSMCILLVFMKNFHILKFILPILIFISLFNVKIKFINIGGMSYLLHLYHAPVIVVSYSILSLYFSNDVIMVLLQFFISLIILYIVYKILKYYNFNIIIGNRE